MTMKPLPTQAADNLEEAINYYKNKPYMTVITKGGDGSVVVKDGRNSCRCSKNYTNRY